MHRPPSASTHSNPAPHDQTTLRGIEAIRVDDRLNPAIIDDLIVVVHYRLA